MDNEYTDEIKKPASVEETDYENNNTIPSVKNTDVSIELKATINSFTTDEAALKTSNLFEVKALDTGAQETQQALMKSVDVVSQGLQSFKQSDANTWIKTGIGTIPLLKPLEKQHDTLLNGLSNAVGDISAVFRSDMKSLTQSELNDFKNNQKNKIPAQFLKNQKAPNLGDTFNKNIVLKKGPIGYIIESKDLLANTGIAFFVQRNKAYNFSTNNGVQYNNFKTFDPFPYMLYTQDFYIEFPKKKTTKEKYGGIEISKAFSAMEGGNTFGFNMYMDEDLILYKEISALIGSFFNKEGQQQIYSQHSNDVFLDLYVLFPAGNGDSNQSQNINTERFVSLFILESVKLTKVSNPLKFAHNGGTTINAKVSGVCNRISLLTDLMIS